jgi:hypothetical protein
MPELRPIHKMAYVVPVSNEILTEAKDTWDAYNRMMRMTPEERETAAQQAMANRAATRDRVLLPRVLTMSGLLNKLGWSEEYAEHLMQDYCTCSWGSEGWDLCQHAYDLGLSE